MDVDLLLGAEMEFSALYARFGDPFYTAFDELLSKLKSFPEIGPVYSEPFRRLLIPRTPLGVFYTLERDRILVQAILDLRADPERTLQRLGFK